MLVAKVGLSACVRRVCFRNRQVTLFRFQLKGTTLTGGRGNELI